MCSGKMGRARCGSECCDEKRELVLVCVDRGTCCALAESNSSCSCSSSSTDGAAAEQDAANDLVSQSCELAVCMLRIDVSSAALSADTASRLSRTLVSSRN